MCNVAYEIADAATAAGVTKGEISDAIRSDELPAYRIGNQAVIVDDDLREWVRAQPRF